MSVLRVECPHCGSKSRIRTSTQLSTLVRKSYCQCDNVMCGHTFVVHTEVVRTLSPPAKPNDSISLPAGDQASLQF